MNHSSGGAGCASPVAVQLARMRRRRRDGRPAVHQRDRRTRAASLRRPKANRVQHRRSSRKLAITGPIWHPLIRRLGNGSAEPSPHHCGHLDPRSTPRSCSNALTSGPSPSAPAERTPRGGFVLAQSRSIFQQPTIPHSPGRQLSLTGSSFLPVATAIAAA